MAFSNQWGNDVLRYFFNGVAIPSTYTGTNLYLSLHTADPGVGGTQNTSEISYTGYARLPLVRNTTGEWTVSGKTVSNAIARLFGQMTAGAGGVVTHAAVGELVSGAGVLLASGPVTPNITVANGVQPNIVIGAAVLTLT